MALVLGRDAVNHLNLPVLQPSSAMLRYGCTRIAVGTRPCSSQGSSHRSILFRRSEQVYRNHVHRRGRVVRLSGHKTPRPDGANPLLQAAYVRHRILFKSVTDNTPTHPHTHTYTHARTHAHTHTHTHTGITAAKGGRQSWACSLCRNRYTHECNWYCASVASAPSAPAPSPPSNSLAWSSAAPPTLSVSDCPRVSSGSVSAVALQTMPQATHTATAIELGKSSATKGLAMPPTLASADAAPMPGVSRKK